MRGTILLVIASATCACGSVKSAATGDAGGTTGSDAASQGIPGDLVWARSTSALDPLRVQIGTGGIVVAGQLNAPTVIGDNTLVPVGDYDMGIAGFNPADASVLYAVRFGDVGYEAAFVDTLDPGGAPIIQGITSGTANIGTVQLAGGGASDTFIGRYGAGPPAWVHRLATADDDKIIATSLGPNSTVYATGYFVTSATIGTTMLTGPGRPTTMLLRFNTATGALDLATQFGSTGISEGTDIAWRGSSTFIAGEYSGAMATAAGTITAAGGIDAFVARLDDNGAVQWLKSFGNTGNDFGPRVRIDDAGDIYISGTYQGQIAFGAVNLTSAGSDDIYLAKLRGTDGTPQWATSIGSTGSDNIIDLAVGAGGEVCINGTAGGALNIGGGNQGGLDAFIACYQGTAQLRWKRVFGTVGDDRGWGLTFGADGMMYATETIGGPIDLGMPLIGPANPAGLLLKLVP